MIEGCKGTYRGMGKRASRHDVYYVKYNTGNTEFSSIESEEVAVAVEIITKVNGTIEIEYYPHSGIIKSINGIDKKDTDSITTYVEGLVN